jgi:anti-anti-sigma factor
MPLNIRITRSTTGGHHNELLTVALEGSLDSATAPELEKKLSTELDDQVKDVVFDLGKLTFISSAGLRVFAATRKFQNQRDEQVSFVNLQPQIREVFEIVQALPGVSVFGGIEEFDAYIAGRQRKVMDGE